MKVFTKIFLFSAVCLLILQNGLAQQLTVAPGGDNKKASVCEQIGITNICIHYHRPGVKGREGKIWGQVVLYGFNDLGFGTSKQAPWRGGANENTTFTFAHDVAIEGKTLKAGTYGFHVALFQDSTATVIFSNNSSAWGSFYYKPEEDALRVTVKTQRNVSMVEWLTYAFTEQTADAATIALKWEWLKIPFRVSVDMNKIQVESFRREFTSAVGFDDRNLAAAAAWCAQNKTNLDEALAWADQAVNAPFFGVPSFNNFSIKAQVLDAMGRNAEADEVMKKAMDKGSVVEIHTYARTLQGQKRMKEAGEIFQLNFKKHGEAWPTHVGMARALSTSGDYAGALSHAKIALEQARERKDQLNITNLEGMIIKLGEKKDVN